MAHLLEFLIPENPAALAVVLLIILTFGAWLIGLFRSGRSLLAAKGQLLALENVKDLVEARKRYLVRKDADEDAVIAQQDFDDCLRARNLTQPIQAIVTHLKSIYIAGCREGQLVAAELIRHTLQELFRRHHALRTTLAMFIVMGLLGTLFGLADSLAELAPIMQQKSASATALTNNEAIVVGLRALLRELKSAFAPSIWGVGLTILGMALHMRFMGRHAMPVQQTLERLTLTVWIPKLYPTRSQVYIETIQETAKILKESVDSAKEVGDFAEKIKGKTGELSKGLDKLVTRTEAVSSTVEKAVETIHETFPDRLIKVSKDFAENIASLSNFQNDILLYYKQMLEDFRLKYGETLDKQNVTLGQIQFGLKSYEDAYVKQRQEIDADMQKFLKEATAASESVSGENKRLIEKLSNQVDVRLADIQDKFQKLYEPLDKTAGNISGSFENFYKLTTELIQKFGADIRGVIQEKLLTQFEEQNKQGKEQLDSIKSLNTQIVELLSQLTANSATQGEQTGNLSGTIVKLAESIKNTGSVPKDLVDELRAMARDMKQVQADIKKQLERQVERRVRAEGDGRQPTPSEQKGVIRSIKRWLWPFARRS